MCETLGLELRKDWVSAEDSVMFLALFLVWVERPKVFLFVCNVVAGPLACEWDEGCVTKVFRVFFVGGDAKVIFMRGRSTLQTGRLFDCTMGYPGEDVDSN